MSQYIKKADALRIVDLHYGPCSGYSEIKRLPAEDVEPVVHGRWVKEFYHPYWCSCCEEIAPLDACGESHYKSNYCPNCGARMDGE